MGPRVNLITDGDGLALDRLQQLQQRPAPFAQGEVLFWDDPHISEQMLSAHLDPKFDGASRRPHIIDGEVEWLMATLELHSGDSVLDLGCGPGLYAARLARHGLQVTGVDYAQRPIAWARRYAEDHGLAITYLVKDYLELDYASAFDVVALVNGDFGVLGPEERHHLLTTIRRALKPGGQLALDVVTPRFRDSYMLKNQWYVAESGFWRPGKHLVLEEGFDYPKDGVFLNQYVIVDPDATVTIYRNWFQTYTPASISDALRYAGFTIAHIGGDLRGSVYTDRSEWIGVIARTCPTEAG